MPPTPVRPVLSDADKLRAEELAYMYAEALEIALPMNSTENGAEMARANDLRKQLEDMGFRVAWEMSALFDTTQPVTALPKVRVDVTLWLPKEDPDSDA